MGFSLLVGGERGRGKGLKHIIKMILALFDAVPTGAIETLFDEQNQPLLKRADLGKYLGIKNIKETYRDIETIPQKYVLNEGALVAPPKVGTNWHVAFISLDHLRYSNIFKKTKGC